MGPSACFVNLRQHKEHVYCTFCKGVVGNVKDKGEETEHFQLRHHRLIRVDPRYTYSICLGRTHDPQLNPISHLHLLHSATVEHEISAPILPVELRSIRGGHQLDNPCPFATNYLPTPGTIVPDFLTFNPPQQTLTLDPDCLDVIAGNANDDSVIETGKIKTYSKANKGVETPVENERSSPVGCIHDQPSTSYSTHTETVEVEILPPKRRKLENSTFVTVSLYKMFLFCLNL